MLGLSVSRVGWKIGDDYASKGEAKKVFGNRIGRSARILVMGSKARREQLEDSLIRGSNLL